MELEEMQSLWADMSRRVEKLEIVNKEHIMEMTQQKYKNKFSKLMMLERFGALICVGAAIFMLVSFGKLDTWYLQGLGILTISCLLILPVISLGLLSKLTRLDLSQSSYKETLTRFEKANRNVLNLQKGAMYLSVLLMFSSMPVFNMLFNGKDMFEKDFSIGYIIFVIVIALLVVLFSRWGYRCYVNISKSAKKVLSEMEE